MFLLTARMGVLTALAILAGLIVVHEAGHFFAATWQGIRVSGFSVGFGPVLLQRQRRGVQFALRAIPLGGFVSFPDDDEDSPIPADDPDLLRNRPLPQRALVIAAGVLANLLLAWSVLVAQGLVVGIPAGFSTTPGVLVSGVQSGQAAALVTGPVSKKKLQEVGFTHPGQTEFIAERCGVSASNAAMMLAGPGLRVIPITIHIPLAEVPSALTTELIVSRGRVAAKGLTKDFGIEAPRIAVAGLNPHAGEQGSMGDEEATIIMPAIEQLRADGDVTRILHHEGEKITEHRILQRIDFGVAQPDGAGALDADLPRAAPATLYARLGDRAFLILLLAVCVVAISFDLRQKMRYNQVAISTRSDVKGRKPQA